MTLQEVMNKNKRFRIVGTEPWFVYKHGSVFMENGKQMIVNMNTLTSDYEIDEKKYTLTEKQLRDAFTQAFVGAESQDENYFIILIEGLTK